MIRITTFAGKTVAVFGLARSGIVSAEALRDGGATVACWDDSEAGRAAVAKAGLPLVDLQMADWSQFAALVLAPGVPLTHPTPHWTVERAKAAGVEIIGDIELFFRERAKSCPECPVVAITGTNGKSTTTALIAHVLRSAGKDVQMGGNIGVGVLSLQPPAPDRYFVIEMSSFQIDLTPSLKPTVGVLTNITPDHLDRHGTMENYAAIKGRLVAAADFAVINRDDDLCHQFVSRREVDCEPTDRFSMRSTEKAETYVEAGIIYRRKYQDSASGNPVADTAADLRGIGSLRGLHNAENAAAAFAVCASLGVPAQVIAAGLKSFPGLAHRLEELGHIGRVLIVNDSKGTNADSTDKALSSFPGDLFWIAGGVAKEGGIQSLWPHFIGGPNGKVRRAYLIGQCAPEFARRLAEHKVPHEISGTLETALQHAVRDASASPAAEPVILLSPACASYDQYQSFEHRGDHFRQLAMALPGFKTKAHA